MEQDPDSKQKQHVQIHRKLGLRRDLLANAVPGAAFVPFCGDGDIAVEVYADRVLVGCDIDPERVATIDARLPEGSWAEAEADTFFEDHPSLVPHLRPFAVADFDAYSYPYACFRDFWAHAPKAEKVVMFFTDGQRHSMFLNSNYTAPWGEHITITDEGDLTRINVRRRVMQRYLAEILEPWLREAVAPAQVTLIRGYNRGQMLYWGAVVESAAPPNVGNVGSKERKPATEALPRLDPSRAYKLTKATRERILWQVSRGETFTTACRRVGVNLRTLERHVEQDPDFREQLELAQMEAIDEIENALFLTAKSGNVSAQTAYLYNRAPDRWSDRRRVNMQWDEAAYRDVGDIIGRHIKDPEAIRAIRAELAQRAAAGGNP